MCSPSVGSGTSWAQCASGSVNENGCAVCACVRAAVVQWHVTVVVGGGGAGGRGWRKRRRWGGAESDWRRSWTRPDGGATKVETIRDKPSRINTRRSVSLSVSQVGFASRSLFPHT